jgi:outer membrane protein TolC
MTPSTASLFLTSASGWNIGAGLTAPLFHGGALRANVRAKRAAAAGAMATYRKTVLQAFTQVADVLEALRHDQEETEALERAEQSAAQNLRSARIGFQKGGTPFINVLDAQREHSQAIRNLVQARGRRFADMALLYVATGADWQEAEHH